VLGIDKDLSWDKEVVQLRSGDFVLIHTDGLHEATNFADEPFGLKRVREAAVKAVEEEQTAEGLAKAVLWEMRRFTGLQTRLDDLTLICMKVL